MNIHVSEENKIEGKIHDERADFCEQVFQALDLNG
eukprot:CAMPEP_0172598670 /NCGR_PEP_ID=MMETSP1068-20121228/18729_1 /TAXON_ID=35684 /ORGANISM="Pseudopedinella elastica, Strain CCMP716" /LENGTH=34 /DNA_ID= /DNA_START= /DNA_END= /DNA_ORIENTATION=